MYLVFGVELLTEPELNELALLSYNYKSKNSMARIFNIYFTYDDVTHNAVVSVRTTPFFTEYTLGNLDADLNFLLPSSKIISNAPGHLFFQNTTQVHSQNLMDVIIKSIAKHLVANNDITSHQ